MPRREHCSDAKLTKAAKREPVRVDWQQSIEGYSLLEIRNILRTLHTSDAPFGTEHFARMAGLAGRTASTNAQRLIDGLIASGIVRRDAYSRRSDEPYILTDTGVSLRAANAKKRLTRARADKALAGLMKVVAEINASPIYLHDVV